MKGTKLNLRNREVASLNKWKKDINQGQYRPFITVRKVNKVGRRHWMYCPQQCRDVHLLSDGEFRAYNILLWSKGTVAVMEQYALDVDETMEIAKRLGFVHPRNHDTNEVHIMTTDFVVRRLNPITSEVQSIAYTFKYFDQIYDDLDGKQKAKSYRTWQKFSIENEYWNERGIEYRVITERDATKERCWNIEFCQRAANINFPVKHLEIFLNVFKGNWQQTPFASLDKLVNRTACQMDLTNNYVLDLFKHAVINELLVVEHTHCLRSFRPVILRLEPLVDDSSVNIQ